MTAARAGLGKTARAAPERSRPRGNGALGIGLGHARRQNIGDLGRRQVFASAAWPGLSTAPPQGRLTGGAARQGRARGHICVDPGCPVYRSTRRRPS